MKVKRFEVWLVNFNPRYGTEVGKTRPAVVIQTNLLNKIGHPSTIVCPMSTNIKKEATILRVGLKDGEAGLIGDGDILVDQPMAIDNRRFRRRLGLLPEHAAEQLVDALKAILDLED
ncbi:type II toxin-antitoxin system PemK/MazF family toxin [Neolewinella aurantiaca]|uniref:mRNA interferase n=1 Tax=Neolewinella aurantiaca TaxID=2602767 RepID=A0A5C7FFP1_9BACT|nr:type II toxin-antitoxin system PemK/MazF family toxin [Neolewinella aurantiaca]TXF89683.1 type II toxin-antitoxin system PemK/MazF family toxin [Neolewinella aurantiaca]